MKIEVRGWYINEALTSFRRLGEVIDELTEEEVRQALRLEDAGLRRKSVVNRLRAKAKKLFNPSQEQ